MKTLQTITTENPKVWAARGFITDADGNISWTDENGKHTERLTDFQALIEQCRYGTIDFLEETADDTVTTHTVAETYEVPLTLASLALHTSCRLTQRCNGTWRIANATWRTIH